LTLTELADRVGPSMSPCHRRLRALEHAGVIAVLPRRLNPATVGLTFEALVFVTMRGADLDTVTSFEQAVNGIAQIITPSASSANPTTCSRSSPLTCPPSSSSTTPNSPPLPGVQNSPRPS